jgi:hypothetical protein
MSADFDWSNFPILGGNLRSWQVQTANSWSNRIASGRIVAEMDVAVKVDHYIRTIDELARRSREHRLLKVRIHKSGQNLANVHRGNGRGSIDTDRISVGDGVK